MALVADSFHMLSDIAALVIAFLSVRMAPKSWNKNTFGWARAEVRVRGIFPDRWSNMIAWGFPRKLS